MLKSMTGYGTTTLEQDGLSVTVEIKTLNSKFMDINARLPKIFNDKEMEVRNLVTEKLERGKVALNMEVQNFGSSEPKVRINKDLVKAYYEQLQDAMNNAGASSEDLFRMAMQMPEAMENLNDSDDNEKAWKLASAALAETIDKCNNFRKDEGQTLESNILQNIQTIRERLADVVEQNPTRTTNIKDRIKNNLEEFIGKDKVDENRFEQELVYYMEKLDINEEIVRLGTHLDYFDDTAKSDKANGKKLGFISQEIGREINTIGSKANDVVIQKVVVQMKDELEKIKEQLLNIL